MESTRSRELMKSIVIMAGIPLAFSVACSLFARISKKKISSLHDQIQESIIDSMCNEDHLKEQILTLRCKIEELKQLEREIENNLAIEKERAELFEEKKKCDEMMIAALEEVESLRLENCVVKRREKRLLKKSRESLRWIEAYMSSELKRKEITIEGFEREVEMMRAEIKRLQYEKEEVLKKLQITDDTYASKAEEERTIFTENCNRVVNELENIKKERASELRELIYLRWCNACLRHELARRKLELEQETKHDEQKVNNHEPSLESNGDVAPEECKGHESDKESVVKYNEPFFVAGQQHTKCRWLVRKFKKWVEGNEKHHEAKCFGSHE